MIEVIKHLIEYANETFPSDFEWLLYGLTHIVKEYGAYGIAGILAYALYCHFK